MSLSLSGHTSTKKTTTMRLLILLARTACMETPGGDGA